MKTVRVTFDLTPGPLALLKTRCRVVSGDADGLICLLRDRVDASVMTPRLKVIAQLAVGVDNIDLAAARERGIVVTNTPDVLTDATADLAFALILACARGIVKGDRFMRTGAVWRWEPFGFLGRDLARGFASSTTSCCYRTSAARRLRRARRWRCSRCATSSRWWRGGRRLGWCGEQGTARSLIATGGGWRAR